MANFVRPGVWHNDHGALPRDRKGHAADLFKAYQDHGYCYWSLPIGTKCEGAVRMASEIVHGLQQPQNVHRHHASTCCRLPIARSQVVPGGAERPWLNRAGRPLERERALQAHGQHHGAPRHDLHPRLPGGQSALPQPRGADVSL